MSNSPAYVSINEYCTKILRIYSTPKIAYLNEIKKYMSTKYTNHHTPIYTGKNIIREWLVQITPPSNENLAIHLVNILHFSSLSDERYRHHRKLCPWRYRSCLHRSRFCSYPKSRPQCTKNHPMRKQSTICTHQRIGNNCILPTYMNTLMKNFGV